MILNVWQVVNLGGYCLPSTLPVTLCDWSPARLGPLDPVSRALLDNLTRLGAGHSANLSQGSNMVSS